MCHVLIVDDDDEIRRGLAQVLTDEGYNVREAMNGKDALQALRSADAPCLILLDLMMPVMDGWQFRHEQLADRSLSEIPVVIFSADGSARMQASTMEAADGFTKPIRLELLLATVGRYCRHASVAA